MSRFERTNFGLDTKKPDAYRLLHRCYRWPFRGVIALKYNLKNRPKPTIGIYHTHGDAQDYIHVLDRWVKGFEKELRELFEYWMRHHNADKCALIEQILGE